LDDARIGISHAIGVGGRGLSPEVGGIMTLPPLPLLAAHPTTQRLALPSPPPPPPPGPPPPPPSAGGSPPSRQILRSPAGPPRPPPGPASRRSSPSPAWPIPRHCRTGGGWRVRWRTAAGG